MKTKTSLKAGYTKPIPGGSTDVDGDGVSEIGFALIEKAFANYSEGSSGGIQPLAS